MTETARDALARRASGASTAPTLTARDALKRRADGETFTPKTQSFSAPYAYYTPEVQRVLPGGGHMNGPLASLARGAADVMSDFSNDPVAALKAAPAGINRGFVDLAGMAGDTAQNLLDMGGAAYSAARSSLTGEDPNELYQVPDRAQTPLTSDWLARKLDEGVTALGGSPVTQLQDPDNAAARLVYGAARAVPGAASGRQALAGAASGGAATAVAEATGDPTLAAAAGLAGGHTPGPQPGRKTPQQMLNEAAAGQSMGAAGTAVDLEKLSPELRGAVTKAVQETGGAVNPDVLARQVQADSLPVKVRLSEGQALGDARLISEERNVRGKKPGYVEGFNAQNKALTENLRAFRDTAGENVFSTNQVEHADTFIKRYNDIDEAREKQISADYQALRDANGGAFPVDAKALVDDATAALHKKLLFDDAPPSVMKTLNRLAEADTMTFENFESLRSNLATIQRSHTDNGNVRAAAGVIRDAMERLPLAADAAALKPLADKARASAKERFDALKADPAYKAAVDGTTSPDKFVQKFVIGGDRDNVAKLAEAMKGDETAASTLEVATLDHLRQAAGIDGSFNGKFTQAGFNKAKRALEPKMSYLLRPELQEHVQNLSDVARYTQEQPEGSYVNNSNTFVAQAAEHAGDILEGAANVKAGGIPVGTWVRQNITDRAGRKEAEKTFAPGAGLTKLSDLAKIGKKDKK